MKKTFIFALMAAALGFTACSSDDDSIAEKTTQKGMVLHATVAEPADSRATFTDNEGVWKFDFKVGDVIKVTNKKIGYDDYYNFTYNGTDFVSTDAVPTTEPTKWYAYFPSSKVSLVGQTGKWEDIANMYAMMGATTDDTTGEDGLSITLEPKVAILKIINQKGNIDINVLCGENKWISEIGVTSNSRYFNSISYEDTKQTLLSTTKKGTYYIAVPAGIQLAIKDGDESVKSTGTSGLTAGKYYEILVGANGKAAVKTDAKVNGNEVKWVQLWENGPKWATVNVGVTDGKPESDGGYYTWGGTYKNGPGIKWNDDHDTGSVALTGDNDTATNLWGSNWRMPTKDELFALKESDNCTRTMTTQNGVYGLLCTGKGVYASNSVFFPVAGCCDNGNVSGQGSRGRFWSSTPNGSTKAFTLLFLLSGPSKGSYSRDYGFSVRAVLKE